MPDLTPAELEAIRERCEKATPGPWQWTSCGEKCYSFVLGSFAYMESEDDPPPGRIETESFDEAKEEYVTTAFCNDFVASCEEQSGSDDFEFISHSRTDIPRLLAEVARLTAENERLRHTVKDTVLLCRRAANAKDVHGRVACVARVIELAAACGVAFSVTREAAKEQP